MSFERLVTQEVADELQADRWLLSTISDSPIRILTLVPSSIVKSLTTSSIAMAICSMRATGRPSFDLVASSSWPTPSQEQLCLVAYYEYFCRPAERHAIEHMLK